MTQFTPFLETTFASRTIAGLTHGDDAHNPLSVNRLIHIIAIPVGIVESIVRLAGGIIMMIVALNPWGDNNQGDFQHSIALFRDAGISLFCSALNVTGAIDPRLPTLAVNRLTPQRIEESESESEESSRAASPRTPSPVPSPREAQRFAEQQRHNALNGEMQGLKGQLQTAQQNNPIAHAFFTDLQPAPLPGNWADLEIVQKEAAIQNIGEVIQRYGAIGDFNTFVQEVVVEAINRLARGCESTTAHFNNNEHLRTLSVLQAIMQMDNTTTDAWRTPADRTRIDAIVTETLKAARLDYLRRSFRVPETLAAVLPPQADGVELRELNFFDNVAALNRWANTALTRAISDNAGDPALTEEQTKLVQENYLRHFRTEDITYDALNSNDFEARKEINVPFLNMLIAEARHEAHDVVGGIFTRATPLLQLTHTSAPEDVAARTRFYNNYKLAGDFITNQLIKVVEEAAVDLSVNSQPAHYVLSGETTDGINERLAAAFSNAYAGRPPALNSEEFALPLLDAAGKSRIRKALREKSKAANAAGLKAKVNNPAIPEAFKATPLWEKEQERLSVGHAVLTTPQYNNILEVWKLAQTPSSLDIDLKKELNFPWLNALSDIGDLTPKRYTRHWHSAAAQLSPPEPGKFTLQQALEFEKVLLSISEKVKSTLLTEEQRLSTEIKTLTPQVLPKEIKRLIGEKGDLNNPVTLEQVLEYAEGAYATDLKSIYDKKLANRKDEQDLLDEHTKNLASLMLPVVKEIFEESPMFSLVNLEYLTRPIVLETYENVQDGRPSYDDPDYKNNLTAFLNENVFTSEVNEALVKSWRDNHSLKNLILDNCNANKAAIQPKWEGLFDSAKKVVREALNAKSIRKARYFDRDRGKPWFKAVLPLYIAQSESMPPLYASPKVFGEKLKSFKFDAIAFKAWFLDQIDDLKDVDMPHTALIEGKLIPQEPKPPLAAASAPAEEGGATGEATPASKRRNSLPDLNAGGGKVDTGSAAKSE